MECSPPAFQPCQPNKLEDIAYYVNGCVIITTKEKEGAKIFWTKVNNDVNDDKLYFTTTWNLIYNTDSSKHGEKTSSKWWHLLELRSQFLTGPECISIHVKNQKPQSRNLISAKHLIRISTNHQTSCFLIFCFPTLLIITGNWTQKSQYFYFNKLHGSLHKPMLFGQVQGMCKKIKNWQTWWNFSYYFPTTLIISPFKSMQHLIIIILHYSSDSARNYLS